MSKNKDKFYITTPIYYASGAPHLGHAYTSIAADILARWNRDIGKEVFFQTGTDEHGQKIVETAKKINKEPSQFVDFIVPQFKDLMKKLNISYDYFIRTTDDNHKKIVQEMLQKSFDNGDIYKGKYEGLYCVDCERYYVEEDLIEGKICPDHKKETEFVSEENYFFKLSKYEKKLLDFYKKNSEFLSPNSKAQETVNRVKEGLQDISISRNKKKLNWGIELPFDKEHVTYVWFDALFNYYSGTKINDKEDYWPASVHLIGKDIMWFHKVYWPAFLMSVGLELPKKVFAHGFIINNNHKMSKSLGNVINPIKYAKTYGADEFRFSILALGSFGEDINFTEELFVEKINNYLNNDLGNLVSRVHAMTDKYFKGVTPTFSKLEKVDEEYIAKLDIFKKFNSEMQDLKFNFAIETLWGAIRECNAYVNLVSPWKEQDEKRLATIMNILISSVCLFSKYVNCFIPEKSKLIFKQYNLENDNMFDFALVKDGIKLGEKENLFERIKLEKKEEVKDKPKEGFEKLNLVVGKIIEVDNHPNSEKLFKLKVDLGNNDVRQILSGLVGIYDKSDLENREVVVISNLKPAKMGGEVSEGMVLAVENDKGECGLLTTTLKVGENIKCEDLVANNTSKIKINHFVAVEMIGKNNKVTYQGKEISGLGIDKKLNGKVC